MTLSVFDPAMCCSTGVCGPSVAPELARFAADVDWLQKQGVTVERFNLSQQPAAFAETAAVKEALGRGTEVLPLVLVGDRIAVAGSYPSRETLETPLAGEPRAVTGVTGLYALNIDPEAAAHAYRERMVGPYRGVLPDAAVRSIEEQLSGACTVEIAAFGEFSKLLGDARATADFDHVVFDTAPTGHTLRLLELPAAWTGFLETNVGGTSCLGPLAGLKAQQALYDGSRAALIDGSRTALVLVSRADRPPRRYLASVACELDGESESVSTGGAT